MTSGTSIRVFGERDASLQALEGKLVAAIGYGHLGRSMALNLRDSGLDVIVGNRDDEYAPRAVADGFNRLPIADAVEQADVVYFLLPDEVVEDVFFEVKRGLKASSMIVFPSGYNVAFGLIDPPGDMDVCLLAPRMVGVEIRDLYEAGEGFFSFVNVEQDQSGAAWDRLLALALASGSLRRGALQLSARDEAALDLFIEQGVGPYIGTAMQLAFQLGVEAGLPAEALVLEMYMSGEMSQTIDSWARNGFYRSVGDHGPTAQFGGFIRATGLDRPDMEQRMRAILEEIRDGRFAKEFQAEKADGYPRLGVVKNVIAGSNPQTKAEESLRKLLKQAGTS